MDIEFCGCGGMMVPAGGKIRCRTCGRTVDRKMDAKIVTQGKRKDVIVFEDNDPGLPRIEKECEKCQNSEAFFMVVQTRSSDEPPTRFFRCTRCKHTWREYQ